MRERKLESMKRKCESRNDSRCQRKFDVMLDKLNFEELIRQAGDKSAAVG